VVVGTYSSVYIASPVLLWLSGVSASPAAAPKISEPTRAAAAVR
jgi:preprotein translocase subunit SecF